jgi:hypothetical protein
MLKDFDLSCRDKIIIEAQGTWFQYFDDVLSKIDSFNQAINKYKKEKEAGLKFELYKDINWSQALSEFHSKIAKKFNISRMEFAIELIKDKLYSDKGIIVEVKGDKAFVFSSEPFLWGCGEQPDEYNMWGSPYSPSEKEIWDAWKEPKLPFKVPEGAQKEFMDYGSYHDASYHSGYSFPADLLPTLLDTKIPKNAGLFLSKREIIKEAQDPAKRTAESLFKIIQFLFYRVPPKNKLRYLSRIRGKIVKIPPGQLAIKKTPPSAAIGQSIAISKNLLSGLNPTFVAKVLEELVRLLSVGHI